MRERSLQWPVGLFGVYVQRMYRGRLKSGRGVFVKQVPASVWRYQWKQQQRFQGQFMCDGENYVGEAAAAAFLTGASAKTLNPIP